MIGIFIWLILLSPIFIIILFIVIRSSKKKRVVVVKDTITFRMYIAKPDSHDYSPQRKKRQKKRITKTISRRTLSTDIKIEDIVCIDFETANEKRDSPCAVGICYYDNSGQMNTRSWLIRPKEMRFNKINVKIHGLKPELFKDKPDFKEVWTEIFPLLNGKTLAAHYAPFDCSVLDNTLDLYDIPNPGFNFVCTCLLAQNQYPELENHKLPTVAKKIGAELSHHIVESDVKASMKIITHILGLHPEEKPYSILKSSALF